MPHYYQNLDGFFWFEEAYRRMLDTLPKDRASRFVEIGSYQGKSAAFLGVEILHRQLPCTLHCVDSWERPNDQDGAPIRVAFERNMAPLAICLESQLEVHAMGSTDAARLFADDSIDVVFVDGDHSYEGVTADILAWFPKVRPGGFIGGDDFLMRPVMHAVVNQFGNNYILLPGWTTVPEPQAWPSWLVKKG